MRYADTLLSDGEVIVLRSRQHLLALFLDARLTIVLWVAGLVLLAAVPVLNLTGLNAQIASVAAIICLLVGLVIFGYRYWQWWAQDYIVTNRRLMKVTGILNKRSSDSSLEKINDAILDQNLIGRILNYGDLDIMTASGESAVDFFRMLKGAKEFKRVMLNQKHGYEMEMTGRPPAPPMRASAVDMNGEPTRQTAAAAPPPPAEPMLPTSAAEPAAVSAPAMETPPEMPDESRDITQTLARLADLRDKGAISEEEYAAKKDELLRRL